MIRSIMTLLLGLDIGTSSLKAVLYDTDQGLVMQTASRPTPTHHPQEGWSEHDPQALWAVVADCIRQVAAGKPVSGLAISSMAEAGLLIDNQGQALTGIIAWYDRRSEPQAAWVEQQITLANLYRLTGQRVSPSFGITKLLWLREHQPEAFARAARWLPVPAYLLWRLTGQFALDYTIAARTLLFDQNTLNWSPHLLETFGLPAGLFPPIQPGGTAVAAISARAAEETGLPPGVMCVLGGHDHLCAALATGAYTSGMMVDSTGSANALILLTPHFLPEPRLGEQGYASYAYLLPGLYTLKGGLKAAGSAVEWLTRQLSSDSAAPDYAGLEADAAKGVAQRAGPLWLPHWIGSGTPEGDRFSQAALVGVQFEHDRGDLFRALLESIAFWTRANVEEMQIITGQAVPELTLIGGVTRLRLLSQLKADVLNRPVLVPKIPEAAATGAALLAGLGCGIFASPAEAIASLHYDYTRTEPISTHVTWYDRLYQTVYRPLYTTLKPIQAAFQQLAKPN